MAVKFEFTLSDIDAFNLICAIQHSCDLYDFQMIDLMADKSMSPEMRDACIKHVEDLKKYTMSLIEQMHNTKIEE